MDTPEHSKDISRRSVLFAGAAAGVAGIIGTSGSTQMARAAQTARAAGAAGAPWIGVVFQQIDYNSGGYGGFQETSGLQSKHADFPGGGSPQTQRSLPCNVEPITDYVQAGFPWPPAVGFMSPPWITGPSQTGVAGCIASLYLGTGVGSMGPNDSHGLPLNSTVVRNPASMASLPVPAGTWPGAPKMPGGGAAIPAVPVIAWNLSGQKLKAISSGSLDASTIIPVASQCKAWPADASGNPAFPGQPGGQVLIRLMHEMNGTWASYCPASTGETCADFVAAWQHIVQVFRAQGATNARWIWAPNICSSGAGTQGPSPWNNTSGTCKLLYPGDAYVDYIGMDGYNKFTPTWRTFGALFQATYNFITAGDAFTSGPISATKPLIITEFSSYEDDMFTSPPQTKGQFISDIATVVPASMPRVQGVMIWHSGTDALEWFATSSPAAATAWKNLANANTSRIPVVQGITQTSSSGPGTPYIAADYTSGTTAGSSFTFPVNKKALTTGDSLCLAIAASNPGITVTSVTDSKGNTYAVDSASSTGKPVAFAYAVAPVALTTSDTITVTLSASNSNLRAIGTGLPGVAAKDLSPAGTGGTGSSFSASTGTLSQQNEVCLGAVCCSGSTAPSALSWTLIESVDSFPMLTMAYKLPGATTSSQTFSGTLPSGTIFDAGVITFK